jgi:hypothetical protein
MTMRVADIQAHAPETLPIQSDLFHDYRMNVASYRLC